MTDEEKVLKRLKDTLAVLTGKNVITNLDFQIRDMVEDCIRVIEKQQEEIEKKDTIINTMQAEFERLENLEDNTDMLKEELKKKNTKIALLEKLYENLQKDFDSFKKDEDIHYLDGVHHKQLVEKSVGQKNR